MYADYLKALIDFLWSVMNLDINIDGLHITLWSAMSVGVVSALFINLIFKKGSGKDE